MNVVQPGDGSPKEEEGGGGEEEQDYLVPICIREASRWARGVAMLRGEEAVSRAPPMAWLGASSAPRWRLQVRAPARHQLQAALVPWQLVKIHSGDSTRHSPRSLLFSLPVAGENFSCSENRPFRSQDVF